MVFGLHRYLYTFLPDMHRLDEKIDLQNKPVRMTRRVLALWLDWLILGMVSGLLIGQQVQLTSVFHSTSGLDELLNGFFCCILLFYRHPIFHEWENIREMVIAHACEGKGRENYMARVIETLWSFIFRNWRDQLSVICSCGVE